MIEDRNDLSNAIALNSSMVNGARLIGPALAGVVISYLGEGWCFLIDGVSYLAVIASLAMMRLPLLDQKRSQLSLLGQMREGWDYVRTFTPIRTVLLLFSITSLMGFPYSVLLPIFAGDVLHGGPHTLAMLTGASAVGALLSAITLAVRKSIVGLLRMLRISAIMLGIALILFGLSHTLWLSLLLMSFAGFGLMQGAAGSNTLIQAMVSDDKRARVMSYYTMAFFGAAPIGSLFAGTLAHRIGAPYTVMLSGVFCIAGAVWYGTQRPRVRAVVRPLYQSMGLLPPDDVA